MHPLVSVDLCQCTTLHKIETKLQLNIMIGMIMIILLMVMLIVIRITWNVRLFLKRSYLIASVGLHRSQIWPSHINRFIEICKRATHHKQQHRTTSTTFYTILTCFESQKKTPVQDHSKNISKIFVVFY